MTQLPVVRPRLVAVDVDDTLLEADLTLAAECIEGIAQAQESGVKVVIATGRMYRSTLPFAKKLGLTGHLITYNGALVRSVSGETLWHKPVPKELAAAMIDVAEREGFCLNLYIDDELIVADIDERVEYYMSIAKVDATVVGDLRRGLERGAPTKCLFVGDAARVPALASALQKAFPDLQITRSKPRFIEVTVAGARKDVGLAAVAEACGIPREAVMAVGDADNDIAMIRWAGLGVAVANAAAEVKAAADAVTHAPRGLGVREALDRFLA